MAENPDRRPSRIQSLPNLRFLLAALAAGIGAAIAIGVMELLSANFNFPLAIIPFATSIVLVIGSPDLPAAQPRALIGGHLISTVVGLIVLKLAGPLPWAAAAAVGVAVLAMILSRTFHPPAGIDPLLVVSANLPWSFLLAPVLAGAILLTVFAFVWHRIILRRRSWPSHWI